MGGAVPGVVGGGELLEAAGHAVRVSAAARPGPRWRGTGPGPQQGGVGWINQGAGPEGRLVRHAVLGGVAGHVAGAGVGVLDV